MRKPILLSFVVAIMAVPVIADTINYYAIVHTGINSESQSSFNVWVDDFWLPSTTKSVTAGPAGTTVTNLVASYGYAGTGTKPVSFFEVRPAVPIRVTKRNDFPDGFTFETTGTQLVHNFYIEVWWDGVDVVSFSAGIEHDDTPRIYYRPDPLMEDLALLATNQTSIAEATTNSPPHVEVWPTRSTLAAARIGEHSRSITWHCVLFDKNKEPYRDNDGNIIVFPVVPEWRKQTEVYTGGE